MRNIAVNLLTILILVTLASLSFHLTISEVKAQQCGGQCTCCDSFEVLYQCVGGSNNGNDCSPAVPFSCPGGRCQNMGVYCADPTITVGCTPQGGSCVSQACNPGASCDPATNSCAWSNPPPTPTPTIQPPPPPPPGGCSQQCGGGCTQNSDCCIPGATNQACNEGICWDGQVCDAPPPPPTPPPGHTPPPGVSPATITGRAYCRYDNLPLPGVRVFASDSLSNTLGEAATALDGTYTLSGIAPVLPSQHFAVRVGGGPSSSGSYKRPTNILPPPPPYPPAYCDVSNPFSYEACTFSSVEGSTVSNYDFVSETRITNLTNSCVEVSPGDFSLELVWNSHPVADKYVVSVFDSASGNPVHYYWYHLNVPPGHERYVDCTYQGNKCRLVLNQFVLNGYASGEPLESSSYYYNVRVVESDPPAYSAYHCISPGSPVATCDSSCPQLNPITNISWSVNSCIVDNTSAQVTWNSVGGLTNSATIENLTDGTIQTVSASCNPSTCTSTSFTVAPNTSYKVIVTSENSCSSTSAEATLSTTQCMPWFQSLGGAIVSGASISSSIPIDTPNEYLISSLTGQSNTGVAVYSTSINPSDKAKISFTGWNAQTPISPNLNEYNYTFFTDRIPAAVKSLSEFASPDTTFGANDVLLGGVSFGGYRWKSYSGTVNLGETASGAAENFGTQKAIIFVDGDLNINREITYNNANGFAMFIVSGNINFGGDLIANNTTKLVKGFFFASEISTPSSGVDDGILFVNGSTAALNGYQLQRDLGDENINTASEIFIYNASDVFKYPKFFTKRNLVWQEVAP